MTKMKDNLDKYEDWLLNSFRRLVSFLSMLLLIGCGICLLGAGKSFLDAVFPEEFEDQNQMLYQPPTSLNATESSSENVFWEVDWESVDSFDKAEAIDKIVDILEKYYRLRSDVYDLDKATADLDIDAEDIVDAVVDGVDSLDELVATRLMLQYFQSFDKFFSTRLGLEGENPPSIPADLTRLSRENSQMNKVVSDLTDSLENPWRGFVERVQYRESLIDEFETEQAIQRAASMARCISALSAAGALFGMVCILTIVLLIFKAENSLRRQADAQEDIID